MRDDPAVTALVVRASDGDQAAWNELIDRFAPLVWSICTRYRLSREDINDVGQTVWLRLVEQLGHLRQPAALPGWLATTTQRECLRVLRTARRQDSFGFRSENEMSSGQNPATIEQEILTAERNAALRAAFAELPARCKQLLSMLISDPPCSYAEISGALRIPIGSIGPQRARCLDRLRKCPALVDLDGGQMSSMMTKRSAASGAQAKDAEGNLHA